MTVASFFPDPVYRPILY